MITPDADMSLVVVPAHALANAREAIIGFIEALEKAGEPVPEEKEPVELATVAL